jgi:hypothetical protein
MSASTVKVVSTTGLPSPVPAPSAPDAPVCPAAPLAHPTSASAATAPIAALTGLRTIRPAVIDIAHLRRFRMRGGTIPPPD